MRKLLIQKFGPVTNAELEIRDMNLFIGEQSIGKSTIAKLITIMTDYYSLIELVTMGLNGWEEQLKAYNLQAYNVGDYFIKYDLEEKDVRFHLEIKKNYCFMC